jgi:hypothetical protein
MLQGGANRAAIVMTWLAFVFDLVSKLDELALGGDANAQQHVDEWRRWCDGQILVAGQPR